MIKAALTLTLVLLISASMAEDATEINATDILGMIERGLPVDCKDCIITGDLDLREANLSKASFIWSDRDGLILIDDIRLIISPINITGSYINGNVNFGNAIFNKSIDFSDTYFNGNATFIGSRFRGKADFGYAKFLKIANFRECKFADRSIFSNAIFDKGAYFTLSCFIDYADFKWAFFKDVVHFDESTFEELAEFQRTIFGKDVYFSSSRFEKDARFWYAIFYGYALFDEAKFSEDLEFYEASFNGDIKLNDAKFLGIIDFSPAAYLGFDKTKLHKDLILDGASINIIRLSEVNLSDKSKISLSGSNFNRFLAPWYVLNGRGSYDNETHLSLIRNYNELGWFEDADDCYYSYKKKSTKISDFFSCLLIGYGVRPWRALELGFIVILLFGALLYYKKCTQELRHLSGIALLYEAFYLSALIFATNAKGINWRDGYLRLKYGKYGLKLAKYKYLGLIEGIIGWLLMALFLITLVKTLIR